MLEMKNIESRVVIAIVNIYKNSYFVRIQTLNPNGTLYFEYFTNTCIFTDICKSMKLIIREVKNIQSEITIVWRTFAKIHIFYEQNVQVEHCTLIILQILAFANIYKKIASQIFVLLILINIFTCTKLQNSPSSVIIIDSRNLKGGETTKLFFFIRFPWSVRN